MNVNNARIILGLGRQSNFNNRLKLRKQLLEALRTSDSPVILDLTEQRTLDAQDIETLLDCVARATGQDTPLFLVAGSHAVRVILEVTQISSVVPVFDSLKEALSLPPISTYNNTLTQQPQFQQRWSA